MFKSVKALLITIEENPRAVPVSNIIKLLEFLNKLQYTTFYEDKTINIDMIKEMLQQFLNIHPSHVKQYNGLTLLEYYNNNGYNHTRKHIQSLFIDNKISLLTKSQLVSKITTLQEMPKRLRK